MPSARERPPVLLQTAPRPLRPTTRVATAVLVWPAPCLCMLMQVNLYSMLRFYIVQGSYLGS